MTVAATDIAGALVDQARELRASQIVIGKSRRSRWFEWRHGSVGLEALAEVRERPKLCGLGLAPGVDVSFLGGYTVLHTYR